MGLIDEHEEVLALSLEDTELFGVPIVLIKPDDTEFELSGQVNIISRHLSVETDSNVRAERSNCTIRLSSISEMPTNEWKVRTSPQPNIQADETYMIEPGGVFPDKHLGVVTIFLTQLEVIA